MNGITDAQVNDVTTTAAYAMCKLAETLWERVGHELAGWEDKNEPFTGWSMRCPCCGECVIVQYIPPRQPLCIGMVINMLPGQCGDRTYIPANDTIDLEVWV